MTPMEKYINMIRKMIDARSLRFKTGVSLSLSISSSALMVFPAAEEDAASLAPFIEAPYPASSTALITAAGEALPSTPMELVSKLTEHESTPGTLDTAFSTRALQAAQLMPVTLYCSILFSPLSFHELL